MISKIKFSFSTYTPKKNLTIKNIRVTLTHVSVNIKL